MGRKYTNDELKSGSEVSGSSMYHFEHGLNEALSQTRDFSKKDGRWPSKSKKVQGSTKPDFRYHIILGAVRPSYSPFWS